MQSREVEIVNPTGLHTRPGNAFVKKAKEYASSVTLVKGDARFNAKSLLTLMKAGVSMGERVLIVAEGPDEAQAVEGLASLVASFTE
jgi:phosphotransferase system HPr (HPr) family protein